jgi:hypothetical protein
VNNEAVNEQQQPKPSPASIALDGIATRQHQATEVARRQSGTWWLLAPAVFAWCLHAVQAPVKLFNLMVETAVSMAVVSVVVTGFFIYTGDIPQEQVAGFLKPIGKKIVDMVQTSATPTTTPQVQH